MNNKHWQYIILLLIFTVLLDFTFGKLYEGLYFSEESRQNDRLIHSVLGTKEDILIFGSSRALQHYNPKIIEDSLGMTCYNVGAGGQNIYFHLALLEATLERYTPKIAILELMSIDFEVTSPQWDTEKLGILLPFYHESEAAERAVLRRGELEKVKTNLSSVYPFNSMQYATFRNNLMPYHNHINGFMPITRVWDKRLEKKEVVKSEIDGEKLKALYQFIELCQVNNIKLFIFVSPHYADFNGESKYTLLASELKAKTGIELISFENEPFFMERPELFADPFHLNADGAKKYSQIIVSIIKVGAFR